MTILLFSSTIAVAQPDGGFGGGGGFPPMGGGMGQMDQQYNQQSRKSISEGVDISSLSLINGEQTTQLVEQLKKKIERHNKKILAKFDTNKDGQLDKHELKMWKQWLSEQVSEGSVDGSNGFGGMAGFRDTVRVGNHNNGMYGAPEGEEMQGSPQGPGPNMRGGAQGAMLQGGPGMHHSSSPTIVAAAANAITAKSAMSGKTLQSDKADESVIRATKGGAFSGEDLTIKKSGGNTTSEDESNFYGLNAAVATETGSSIALNGGSIRTDAEGANAVFAYGKDAKITIENVQITTSKNSSRGLDATFGGSVSGKDITITTQGAHCAALATDRGEGTVKVTNCNATTHGEGSPGIYSTGTISANNSVFYASGSEAAVIEGKNSIALDGCTLTGMKRCGVMLYQSFSGDASVGTSTLNMNNSRLTTTEGPLFYCTNTHTSISLENDELICHTGLLLKAEGNNRWGRQGHNGAQVTLSAKNQTLEGNIIVDSLSTATLKLGSGTSFTGSINSENQSQQVDLILEKGSQVVLTGNSYIRRLALVGMSDVEAKKCIQSNGNKLFIKETGSSASAGK